MGKARIVLEQLELRRLLVASVVLPAEPVTTSLGDVSPAAFAADLDGSGVAEIVSFPQYHWGTPYGSGWYRYRPDDQRWELAAALPSSLAATTYRPSQAIDFDSDGDLDLLVKATLHGNADPHDSFLWLENVDGLGDFSVEHPIIGPDYTSNVTPADLDADGDIDLAYVRIDDIPSCASGWLENDRGVFQFHSLPDCQSALSVDLDGDGKLLQPQIVPSSNSNPTVDLDGDGDLDRINYSHPDDIRWTETVNDQGGREQRIIFMSIPGPKRVYADDIDQDGDYDLWVQTGSELTWLENTDGRATFSDPQPTGIVLSGNLQLADFNADGVLDPFALDEVLPQLTWYELHREARDPIAHVASTPSDEVLQAITDMDSDGDLDFVSQFAWYEPQAPRGAPDRHPLEFGVRPESLAPHDYDADQDVDFLVVWRSERWQIAWFENREDEFQQAIDLGTLVSPPREIELTDFDLDGDIDILWVSDSGRLEWIERLDATTFARVQAVYIPQPDETIQAISDLDGDGDLDVMVSGTAGSDWIENTRAQLTSRTRVTNTAEDEAVGVGDVDGDGDADLVISNRLEISWYENLGGAGTFAEGVTIDRFTSLDRHTIHALQLVDLDGDGAQDLIVNRRDWTGWFVFEPWTHMTWYANDGGGRFSAPCDIHRSRGQIASSLISADLNGDGLPELLGSPWTSPGLVVFWNGGDHFPPGDANLDGRFDSQDLVDVFQQGQYEDDVPMNSDWGSGDWNCDGEFTSEDLIFALQHGDYLGDSVPADDDMQGPLFE